MSAACNALDLETLNPFRGEKRKKFGQIYILNKCIPDGGLEFGFTIIIKQKYQSQLWC